MKLYEVRDIVRENVGRDALSEPVLDWCIRRGLREIEKRDNFYWMEANKVFNILEDQTNPQEYVLANYGMDDFKSSEVLLVSDRTEDDPSWTEVIGPEMIQDVKPNFSEADDGTPAFFSLREDGDIPTMLIWPPVPDQDYRAHWYYYRWTELPIDARSDSHEVLRRWPEALIYLATEQGMLVKTKDPEAGMFWKALFVNANPLVNTELKRIQLYQKERKSRARHDGRPSSGVTTLAARRDAAAKGFF
jgi:hypothetical protein